MWSDFERLKDLSTLIVLRNKKVNTSRCSCIGLRLVPTITVFMGVFCGVISTWKYMMSAVVFALAVAFLLLSRVLFDDYLAPFGIYGFVWLFMVGALKLDLVQYSPVKASTWILVSLSFISFLFGSLTAPRVYKRAAVPGRKIDWTKLICKRRVELVLFVLFAMGLCGSVSYLRAVHKLYGLRTMIVEPAVIRIGQSSQEFQSLYGAGKLFYYVNALFVVMSIFYINAFGKLCSRAIYPLMGVSFAQLLTSMDRTMPFLAIIWAFFFWWYSAKRRPIVFPRTALVLMLIIFLLLTLFVVIASALGKVTANIPQIRAYVNLSDELLWLADPYIYLTGSIPAFQSYVESNQGRTYGAFVCLPMLKLLRIVFPNLVLPREVGEFHLIPFRFNVYTYLNVYYSDFGVLGIVLFPYLVGLLSTLLYVRYRRKESFIGLYLISLVSYCLVLSIFTNRFITTYVWEFIIFGYLISRFITLHRPRPG